VEPSYDTTLAESAYSLAARWDASRTISDVNKLGFATSDVEGYNSNQKSETLLVLSTCPISIPRPIVVVFLERLATYPALPSTHIEHLGVLYDVATTPNAEIRLRFYNFALKDPKSSAALDFASHALKWVTGRDGTDVIKGRMKFCRPTFRGAARVDSTLAKEYFVRSKAEFHPIARKLIEKVRV
jgi:leukotriene-A4 hydrolase